MDGSIKDQPRYKESKEFQIWVLTYLGVNDTAGSGGSSKTRITPWEIGKIVPNSILPSIENVTDVLANLQSLGKAGLLKIETADYGHDPENFLFSLTVSGMIYFRKYLRPLVKIIEEGDKFEEIINRTPSDSATKKEFKTLGTKLKGKMEDEAINLVILTAKRMIPQGITFLAKIIIDNFPHLK